MTVHITISPEASLLAPIDNSKNPQPIEAGDPTPQFDTVNDGPELRLGTSSFTASGWQGVFYPEGLKPADYLAHYSTQFSSVEVDSTFYGIPKPQTVRRWYEVTPTGFLFSVKVPQIITHEKSLVDCGDDLREFLKVIDELKEKRGPILFQFPYYSREVVKQPADFFARLIPFVKALPRDYQFAVEVRNKTFLVPYFLDTLREQGIALALIDHPYMPPVSELFERLDPITANFTYIRWLGDRHAIERVTKSWNKTVLEREPALSDWAKACRQILRRGVSIFAYANNHYAGHAPATIRKFEEIFEKIPDLPPPSKETT